jgi:two-component system response regulator AtoC
VSGRILIVEPDPDRRDALELECAALGYEIVYARDVNRALAAREADEQERERAAARRPLVAASAAMIAVLEEVERLAGESTPVLLTGEAGVGKESLARALHAQSTRRAGPFAVASGRSHAENDPAAMLFGARKPARKFVEPGPRGPIALAEGGTLFLEDVAALPDALQEMLVALLRDGRVQTPLDEKPRPVDVRIVATIRLGPGDDPVRALHPGLRDRFTAIAVPALRERRADLPLLIDHALARACEHLGRPALGIGSDALRHLVTHPWPGNLRELEATILSGVVRARGGVLTLRELPDEIAREASVEADGHALALKPARKAFEADWIRRALRVAGGNRTHAARLLEISHRALLYKLKEFGITL